MTESAAARLTMCKDQYAQARVEIERLAGLREELIDVRRQLDEAQEALASQATQEVTTESAWRDRAVRAERTADEQAKQLVVFQRRIRDSEGLLLEVQDMVRGHHCIVDAVKARLRVT